MPYAEALARADEHSLADVGRGSARARADALNGAPLCTLLADGRDEHELAARLTRRYARLRRLLGLEHVLPPAIRIRSM